MAVVIVTAVVMWFVVQRFVGRFTVPTRPLTAEAVCPSPGGGWTLRLNWPKDVPDFDHYEISASFAGSSLDLGRWSSPAEVKEINGLQPNTAVRIKNVTALRNGDRSTLPATSMEFTPSGAC